MLNISVVIEALKRKLRPGQKIEASKGQRTNMKKYTDKKSPTLRRKVGLQEKTNFKYKLVLKKVTKIFYSRN